MLAAKHGIPVLVADGLPVGAEAAEALVRRLSDRLGHPLDAGAEAFLAAEARHQAWRFNAVLERLAVLGRRRVAVVGSTLRAPALAGFLAETLGWPAAVVLTDSPPEPVREGLVKTGAQIAADGADLAQKLAGSDADLLVGGPETAALAASLGLAHLDLGARPGLEALGGSVTGREGATWIFAKLLQTLEPVPVSVPVFRSVPEPVAALARVAE